MLFALGGSNRYGTIFAITPADKLKTFCNFCPACIGMEPNAKLIPALDADLYSITDSGEIYKMTLARVFDGPPLPQRS
jgi:hypothetical protein